MTLLLDSVEADLKAEALRTGVGKPWFKVLILSSSSTLMYSLVHFDLFTL